MSLSRIISAVIAAVYIIAAFAMGGGELVLMTIGSLILPMGCIWYGEQLGNYIGLLPIPAITQTTPGCLVTAVGWVFLTIPIFLLLIFRS